MGMKTIYQKTDKGQAEIRDRSQGLSASLRRVLILVDGVSPVDKIVQKGAGLPDIIPSLEELEKQGFIGVAAAGDTVASVKKELTDAARQILGSHADKIIAKINEAPDTAEGLEKSMENCKKIVKLLIDEDKAEEMGQRCAEIVKRLRS